MNPRCTSNGKVVAGTIQEAQILTSSIAKELSRAKKLLEKEKYKAALQLVEMLTTQKDLTADDRLVCLLLESQIRIKLGDLEKAALLIDEGLEAVQGDENLPLTVDFLTTKTEVSWRLGNLDEGLTAFNGALVLLEKLELKSLGKLEGELKRRKGELLHHGGVIFWYKGALDTALEYHKESLTIRVGQDDRQGMAGSYNNLGLVYWSKGDFNEALEFYEKSLVINEELGNKRNMAVTLTNIGNVYARKGDLDKALEYQERGLVIKEELGLKHDFAMSLINIGVVYQLKGDLDKALEHYQQSLVIFEQLGIKRDIALAINNLGSIHQLKGDLDQALAYFQRSLTLYEIIGITEGVALALANIGEIYRMKGSFAKAQEYYQQSLTLHDTLENDPLIAIILLELIWINLERGDSPSVQQYLQQLKQINERTENRVIDQRFRVASALVLKTGKRTRDKMKAGEILEQVVEEEIADHWLTVTAMIHLCDLLISELKMTGEEVLFSEIKGLAQRLFKIAEQQSSHFLLVETYLIQSKLALIELDLGRARKLLTTALQIASEKGLDQLAYELKNEQNLLQDQMQKWELIIKEKPTKQDMIDLTKLDDLLGKMVQETVAGFMEERGISATQPKKKYQLEYLDLLKDSTKIVKNQFRVGIAQIGKSQKGDILNEFYQEQAPGLFSFRKNAIKAVRNTLKNMVELANSQEINILILPELTIDLNYPELLEDVQHLSKMYNMYIIPGSYHDSETKHNLSIVVSPEGILWKQEKHIPAIIHFEGKRITEGIDTGKESRTITIANTEYGRIAIVLCRDFLDMDLRVELKNFEPPIDLLINPAFTPVTADFKAAHFDARRSIYAYCFFANVAEFGDSLIYTPEKDRTERTIPPKEEKIIYKDIDLFKLRSERKKWEREHKKIRPFIQSTR
ncbi:MAG: tetratricopeptide repeat protein [Candidatus Odinarchaeota archaeon]